MTRGRSNRRHWAILFLAGALLLFGVISFARRIDATRPVLGVEWVQSSAGPFALRVEPESAAWEAGLREGDLLLRADGRRVTSALEASEIGWDDGAERVVLEIRRGLVRIDLDLDIPREEREEPYAYLAVVGLAFWVSGVFITLRWPMIRGGVVFALLALALFALFTLSHTGRADGLDWSIHWAEVLAGALTPALLLHFGVAVSRRTLEWRRGVLLAAYATTVGLILAAIWLSPSMLSGAYRFDDPLLALELRDRAEALVLAVSAALTAALLFKSHQRSSSVLHRTQMRWLLRGLTFGFGPFALLHMVPWSLGAPDLPNWAQLVAVVPLLFVPAAFTAALARYRLNDLNLILLRGFSEVAAVFCSFAVYAVAVFVLREWMAEIFDLSRSATRYIGLLAMAVAYPKLRMIVRVGVEKVFYRKRYSYRATLLDWARELTADADLSGLLDGLKSRIRETLDIPRAEVLVRTGPATFSVAPSTDTDVALDLDTQALQDLRDAPFIAVEPGSLAAVPWARYLFSMKVKGKVRAVLAVAERARPEEFLTTEDHALLGTLAAHLATTIEAARLVNEVRHRAEEIEQLHARQERILESSAVGLLLLDGEDRIQAWNRALEEIYGLTREETLGRELREVFPLHVVRRVETEASTGTPSGEVRIFRLSMVSRRGQRVVVNLAVSPVGGADGARVVTFDDVSERVKLEEQILQQERLASLGLLAAGMAHEINTPLTGISSYAQMLIEDSEADDPRRPVLEEIEVQTRRAARITGSLLNLARPEETAPEPVDLAETVREVVQLFEPQIRGRGVEFRVDLDDGLPTLSGHKGKLQQVLLNLLLNARDAVGRGGEILIRGYLRNEKICLEVRDDGEGIAEEDLPSIFDPFYTTKGRGKGTGLGLSIAYGIVHEHRGQIHVESVPGEFTSFRVELPLARTARAMA